MKKMKRSTLTSGFLTKTQERIFWSKAHAFFPDSADRNDFMQECFIEAWMDWTARGGNRYGPDKRPDIRSLDIISLNAKNRTAPRKRKEALASSDDQVKIHTRLAASTSLADALDLAEAMVQNPRKRAQYVRHTFSLSCGHSVKLSMDELVELTGMKKTSLNHSKSRRSAIKIYQYKDGFFGSVTGVQRKFSLSEYKARREITLVRLEWAETQAKEATQ